MILTTVLQQNRHAIASSWTERLRQYPGRYRDCPFDDLYAWCTNAIDVIVRSREAGSDEVLRAHATQMAERRAEQGFEIDEVIEGLLLLSESALPFISALPAEMHEEALGAALLLDSSLRLMVAQFATLFASSMRRTVERVAVLEERQRLARDLHDSLSQSLYGVGMCAEAAARLLDAGQADAAAMHLRDVRDSAGEALREMRFLVFELRPSILHDDGLVEALGARLAAVERRVGVRADLQAEGVGRLPLGIEEALYGISREALNNSLRHAHATRVVIRLHRTGDAVQLEVVDNGLGFDTAAAWDRGGVGLSSMRERAERVGGTFAVASRPGGGTTVTVLVALGRTGVVLAGRDAGPTTVAADAGTANEDVRPTPRKGPANEDVRPGNEVL